ncbi:MAG: IS1634 family transposase [Gammaproteobacteria bacterium]
MFLKVHWRAKDGKEHRYYSLVESVRTARGPQHRTLAYLGELNGSAETAWRKTIAVFNGEGTEVQLELFVSDAPVIPSGERVVSVVLDRVRWERPRDFGEVFLAHHLWRLLGLDDVLSERMPQGEEEITWPVMAFILVAARLIAPSSELAIEERFYPKTALEDICGVAEEKVNTDRLYRGLDQLLAHKGALEGHLKQRLGTLFAEPFDILLYDLTSTYFEGLAQSNPAAKRGYSRDHRPDCVQIVIGLVVSKSGLPLGYEVFHGNRAEPTTLDEMMSKMEALYGKASRIWVFDRGVASEKNLEALRKAGGLYLVGTPRTLLRKVEAALLDGEWKMVREGIEVKLVPAPNGGQDTFILCRSADRKQKEAAIHDRFEKKLEDRLIGIQTAVQKGRLKSRDLLQQRLGRAKLECSRVARAYSFKVEGDGERLDFSWEKEQPKADYLRHTEGAYLLRTNLKDHAEQDLWTMYMQLNDAEAAFRTLKQDLSIRPIYHQLEKRVNAHVLVCFLAYALYRTLDGLAKANGLNMTARRILSQLATIKSGDIILPLLDGRELRLRRVSRPDPNQAEILARLGLDLPKRIGTDSLTQPADVVQT